ncbi:hypothetical protein MSAN_00100800 [Mycena sanguinolenta]|uniref:HAMP domain-containing protein n=1 Tax=Mycena sanguinolenta TaxID=230812 RepID=A0A8H6ZD39_9AGAR|nr:hypothetical protein MSAN_00100800 [Mycena sanguinolenta]
MLLSEIHVLFLPIGTTPASKPSEPEQLDHRRGHVSRVCNAVATSDFTQKITIPIQGNLMVQLKTVINTMVDNLGHFTTEVMHVSCDIGTEEKLGAQAHVEGVEGTWCKLTDEVNTLAMNLTEQIAANGEILDLKNTVNTMVLRLRTLTVEVTIQAAGEINTLKDMVNRMVDQLSAFASEVTHVAVEVGTEGKLDGQVEVEGMQGMWKDLTDNVNASRRAELGMDSQDVTLASTPQQMASNLTGQVRSISDVTKAVANGDLTKTMEVDVSGEMLYLKVTINEMVTRLGNFSREVMRVALEVGTEGKLGGQAGVEGVQGTWKDLTGNVNVHTAPILQLADIDHLFVVQRMVSNPTNQVHSISEVTTAVAQQGDRHRDVTKAVAHGDLRKKIDVDVGGEMLDLEVTINEMVARLGNFSREVTHVALEVGMQGKLGGQAEVEGVQGTLT